jgi:hypothetical protein
MKNFLMRAALLLLSSFAYAEQPPTEIPDSKKVWHAPNERNIFSKEKKLELDLHVIDLQWAWDEFNHRGAHVWACRGVQTGIRVASSYCVSQPKEDTKWPDKDVPPDYNGAPDFY